MYGIANLIILQKSILFSTEDCFVFILLAG